MRRLFAVAAALLLVSGLCAALVGCTGDELTLYVPDGAPALSVAKIIGEGEIGGGSKLGSNRVRACITTGEDVIAKCGSGEADIAVLPTNAAVKICATRGDYLLVSVNVYGVLYIVGTEQVTELSALVARDDGDCLLSIGLGNTPEYVFKTVCDSFDLPYADAADGAPTEPGKVNIVYNADATTIIPQILQGKAKFALIGEPAVTQLIAKAALQGKPVYNLFDLQSLWQQAVGSEQLGYPQASLIVKRSVYNSDIQRRLQTSLQANAQYLADNADDLNQLLRLAGSALQLDYTADLLARCNLTYIPAREAAADIEKYLDKFEGMAQFLPLKDDILA